MGQGSSQDGSRPRQERGGFRLLVGLLLRRLDEDLDRPDPLLVQVVMMAAQDEVTAMSDRSDRRGRRQTTKVNC